MRRIPALLLLPLALTACGEDSSNAGNEESAHATTLTVYAAASLTDTFTELGETFEAENDGVTVEFNFAGSSDLAEQINQGAPADVFASADTANMDKVSGAAQDFATNTLQIATPPDNPAGIEDFAGLAGEEVKVVVCAPEVPCGAAAVAMEDATGVDISPVSEEQSVTDVLGKVASGEADAGLVYVTDVTAAGDDVLGVAFDEAGEVVNTYPIVALDEAEEPDLAAEFVELVLSETGRDVLGAAGFGTP